VASGNLRLRRQGHEDARAAHGSSACSTWLAIGMAVNFSRVVAFHSSPGRRLTFHPADVLQFALKLTPRRCASTIPTCRTISHPVPLPASAVGDRVKLAERYSGRPCLAVGAHADDVGACGGRHTLACRRAGARVVRVGWVSLCRRLPSSALAEQGIRRILGCRCVHCLMAMQPRSNT